MTWNDWTPMIIAVSTAAGLKLLDAVLPKGWHLKWVDKWATKEGESG